jgi:hypothetical protein
MGNIFNGHWYHEDTGKGWNCTKCANDPDFALPYVIGDEVYFQLKGYNVTNAWLCDWDGNRILDLKAAVGLSNWRKNISDDLKLFTLRIPPEVQFCQTSGDDCCSIELASSAVISPGLYNLENGVNNGYFDELYWSGDMANNILAGNLPAGWSLGEANGWLEHLIVPCALLGMTALKAHVAGQAPGVYVTYELPVVRCAGIWCDCYITVYGPPENSIVTVTIDGIDYSGTVAVGNVLEETPISVPGFCKPSKHISLSGEGFKIPIKCSLLNSTIEFTDGGALTHNGVFSSENCVTHTINLDNRCWMVEFEVANDDHTTSSIYSEPYECVLCEPTVVVRSDYRNVNVDCLGQYYDLDIAGTVITGNLAAFENKHRIPGVIRNLPSRFGISSNSKCFNYKSEIVERFELQGTKPIPPYLSRMIENVMAGSDFFIDDVEYQVRGESAFEVINEKAISAYKLRATLESCSCEVNFEC